ncbi:MAG: DUF4844 domain-containing protein [Flavobacteriaceae bacterium]|nr:DUF4844 domain-containing protein [Flavobacteriaceae bacterium]
MKTPKNAISLLEDFKETDKFEEDLMLEYSGISEELLKPELTRLINLAVDDFISIAKSNSPTKEKYQDTIKESLFRFKELYSDLSIQDIKRICSYYKELMRYVNLQSSNGHIEKFQRGIGMR